MVTDQDTQLSSVDFFWVKVVNHIMMKVMPLLFFLCNKHKNLTVVFFLTLHTEVFKFGLNYFSFFCKPFHDV